MLRPLTRPNSRGSGSGGEGYFYGRDEAIPAPGQGFDEARIVSRVPQRLADAVDGGVKAVVEVHECATRPKLLLQLFPRHHLAWPLQEHGQDLKRLLPKPDLQPALAQFAGAQVQLEHAEADDAGRRALCFHRESSGVRQGYHLWRGESKPVMGCEVSPQSFVAQRLRRLARFASDVMRSALTFWQSGHKVGGTRTTFLRWGLRSIAKLILQKRR